MNSHQNDDDMRIITSADVLAGLHDDLATKDAEIARILAASRHSADLCAQALDSVRELTAERDALRKDAVIEPERIRAEERERCAQVVEQMTSRKRTIYGAINGEPVADCPIAAAIRGL